MDNVECKLLNNETDHLLDRKTRDCKSRYPCLSHSLHNGTLHGRIQGE